MHGREHNGYRKTEEKKPLGRRRPAWEDILMYVLFNDASSN
jgi:hypothetical protein